MTRGKGPKPKKGPSSSSLKTPSGKLSQNSHSADLLEMILRETEHGKDLEAFADRLIMNYDSKVSKLLDEKLDKLNEQFSMRFGKVEKAILNISEKCTKLNEEMTAVLHKAGTNKDSIENLREELESRDKKIDMLEREIDDLCNRSMRKTLVFRGLPEKADGADTWQNVWKFLLKFLALYDPDIAHLSIDRAHRSAQKIDPHKSKSPRPRPVFAEFVSWQDASRVLMMATKIGKMPYEFEGHEYNISLEQMVSKSVMEKRQTVLKVRKYLMNENPNWLASLRFPAILMVNESEEKQYCKYNIKDDVIKKANEFIDSLK